MADDRAPALGAAAARLRAGAVLALTWRSWRRNALPLLALALLLELPAAALELHEGIPFQFGTWAERAVQILGWLLGATVLGAAGLRAVRGEPVRVLPAAGAGLVAAPRVLLAHVLVYGPCLLALAGLLLLTDPWETVGLRVNVLLGVSIALCVAVLVLRAPWFPLTPLVLEARAVGPLAGVRSAWALTRGSRGALALVLLVPIGFLCANLGWTIESEPELSDHLARSLEGPAYIVLRRAAVALASSALELLPAAAYVLLRREVEPETAALERVFD